jgi:hypothetical protein
MKHSALIHFIPRELASDPHLASQRADDLIIPLQALMVTHVFGQPVAKQLIQGGVLGPRAWAASISFSSALSMMFFIACTSQ